MTPQTLTYTITPAEYESLVAKLKADVDTKVQQTNNGYLVNGHGVTGTVVYEAEKATATIVVSAKPIFLPMAFIKKAFDEHIAEVRIETVTNRKPQG